MRDRFAAVGAIRIAHDGHFLAVNGGAGNRFVDCAGQGPGRAAGNGKV